MDIRTLPDTERTIYNALSRRYSLHFEAHTFGNRDIRLLLPSDLEEVLDGRDPFADVGSFPFWSKLWDSALVLGHVLASLPHEHGDRLLELGAGLGAPGLAAAAAGFEVVLSDYEETILDFQRVSAAASGLATVRCVHFDWLAPPPLEPFTVIAGAEILFREEFVEPLLEICKNYLKPGGTVFLAHDVRRSCLPLFLERAQKEFVIGSRKRTVTGPETQCDILLNRLQRRR